MVNAIRSSQPIDFCTLLQKGECLEVIRRIGKAALDILTKLGKWFHDTLLVCLDPLFLAFGWLFDVPLGSKLKPLEKMQDYRTLPMDSPEFEYGALDLAKPLLTEEEMEGVRTLMDSELFAKIIIRASIFSGRPPIYSIRPPVYDADQWREWFVLTLAMSNQYEALATKDRIALLIHIDSEIITSRTNGQNPVYTLRSKNPSRPNNPPDSNISLKAKEWYERYKAASYAAIHRYHPIMQTQGVICGMYH